MKSIRSLTQLLFAIMVLTLASGCGTTFSPVKVQQSALSGGQKLPHCTALVLNEQFKEYKQKFPLVGGTDVYPIGDALQDYARNVAEKSFQRVDVVPSEERAAALTADDLILIPRVAQSDFSFGHRKYNLTLVIEWAAKDRASGNTILLKTITANASEKMGFAFTTLKHRRQLFQDAFDELGPKTYDAFQQAQELR